MLLIILTEKGIKDFFLISQFAQNSIHNFVKIAVD